MTAERVRTRPPRAGAGRPAVRLLATLALVPPLRLAVARYAVRPGVPDRVGCDRCGAPIGLDRPLPALGPAARCPGCRARIGAAPGVVEALLLVAVAVLVGSDGPPVVRVAIAWWLACAVPLLLVDAAVHRLPDRLTWPAAGGTWALLGVAALAGSGATPWYRATAAGLLLGAGFAATTRSSAGAASGSATPSWPSARARCSAGTAGRRWSAAWCSPSPSPR